MADAFFGQDSYRALPEISRAVEKGITRVGLDRMASDEGLSRILFGIEKYIALTITSFADAAEQIESYNDRQVVLAEHVPPHVSKLYQSVHYGDCVLVLSLVREGSPDYLATRTRAFYGDAAGILEAMGQDSRMFRFMSRKAQPLVEGMGLIGVELDLHPGSSGRN